MSCGDGLISREISLPKVFNSNLQISEEFYYMVFVEEFGVDSDLLVS
jgi:hypothetical protein